MRAAVDGDAGGAGAAGEEARVAHNEEAAGIGEPDVGEDAGAQFRPDAGRVAEHEAQERELGAAAALRRLPGAGDSRGAVPVRLIFAHARLRSLKRCTIAISTNVMASMVRDSTAM